MEYKKVKQFNNPLKDRLAIGGNRIKCPLNATEESDAIC
jgi:hypothetical protein